MQANERYVGFYLGTFWAVIFYILYCLGIWIGKSSSSDQQELSAASAGSVLFSIAGTSSAIHDTILFFVSIFLLIVCQLLWLRLVWFEEDPGSVDTRYDDFEAILQLAVKNGGSLTTLRYCRSLLVRKPIRFVSIDRMI